MVVVAFSDVDSIGIFCVGFMSFARVITRFGVCVGSLILNNPYAY